MELSLFCADGGVYGGRSPGIVGADGTRRSWCAGLNDETLGGFRSGSAMWSLCASGDCQICAWPGKASSSTSWMKIATPVLVATRLALDRERLDPTGSGDAQSMGGENWRRRRSSPSSLSSFFIHGGKIWTQITGDSPRAWWQYRLAVRLVGVNLGVNVVVEGRRRQGCCVGVVFKE